MEKRSRPALPRFYFTTAQLLVRSEVMRPQLSIKVGPLNMHLGITLGPFNHAMEPLPLIQHTLYYWS